jgi:serine/threonine-protein kinase
MEDDTAKIIDFGVVHLTGSQSVTGLKGTVQYMAPEQLELKPATPQSDIFSLGVIAYEALTGRKPFARKTETDTAEAVRLHIPPPAFEINPGAGEQISRVIHKAMAKQPWNRFANARELAQVLEQALRGEMAFDSSKIRPRVAVATKALNEGDLQFASEILNELEAEGNFDSEMAVLRLQVDQAAQQRTIRQLLESARIRMEQEEYPLASQKVQEVLRLDSGNTEALGMRSLIENQRSEREITNWLRLAQQHLDRGVFSEARQGLEEALKLNPNDSRVTQLLAEISRKEQENSKARARKEQFYEAAKQAFQNGEISTALSKLERVLELNRLTPDKSSPERDALIQNFYNQVRSESDANRIAYEDAHKFLVEKSFAKARIICEDNLKKYPGQAIFQALKLEIDERERQELYAYVAEIERRLDAEPDLDRKLNIAREAAELYPQEPQIKQSFKTVRDRRDLVAGIVAKGRQYEDRGQFAEAIGQWEILRGIYPQYPGLASELKQLKERREQQSREEEKSKWVEQTDALLTLGDFEQARDLAAQSLIEFPADPELTGLERLARQGIERRQKSQYFLQQGQQFCTSGQFDEGIASLREAANLDSQNAAARAALITAIIQQAQELMKTDWKAAEPTIQSALELDSSNATAKGIWAQLQDYRRRQTVDICLAEARDLRAQDDYTGAFARIDAGLQLYPKEARLLQFRAGLEEDHSQVQWRAQRSQDLHHLRELSLQVARSPELSVLDSARADLNALAQKYPDDAEFTSLTQAIQQRVHLAAPASPVMQEREAKPNGISPNARPPILSSGPRVTEPTGARANLSLKWAAILAVPLLIIATLVIWQFRRRPQVIADGPIPTFPVTLSITPREASVRVDHDARHSDLKLKAGSHLAEVTMLGYRPVSRYFSVAAGMQPVQIELEPELQHLQILTGFPSGKVLIDGKEAGLLQSGQFLKDDISMGPHAFQVVDGGHELLSVHIDASAAHAAVLTAPLKGNILVLANLGTHGKVYAGTKMQLGNDKGGGLQPIPVEGLAVSPTGLLEMIATDGKHQQTISVEPANYPSLSIYADPDSNTQSTLSITSNVEDVQLRINDKVVNWRSHKGKMQGRLDPGVYKIQLSKSGYQDATSTVDLAKGDKKLLSLELQILPVTSSVMIDGGISGTQVFVDDVLKGQVDASGHFGVEQLTPGSHDVSLRKENFESKRITKAAPPGQPLRISPVEAKLVPFGALDIRISTPSAEISLKRSDENESRSLKNNTVVPLRQGNYTVKIAADGYIAKEDQIAIAPGSTHIGNWLLEPNPRPVVAQLKGLKAVENPAKWREDNGWLVYTGQGYGWISSAKGHYSVDLRKKEGNFLGVGTAIEFVIGYSNQGKNKITYHLGKDGSMTRKATIEGKSEEAKGTLRVTGKDIYRLQIVIDPKRIVLLDARGTVLDDYTSEFDLTSGKFGFKSGVPLSITH